MPEKTDEEIAKQVQDGGVQLFGVLVERYESKLMRYAKKFLLDNDEAKDLVQDVFIKGYTNIQSFDFEKKFSPWIYRIAHNEFINAIKKKKSRLTVPLLDFDILFPHMTSEDSIESEAEKKEVKEVINNGLQKLDDKYREPLVLYYFEDMDYGQIAEVLDIPVSTVGIRLKRGKEMLKKVMGPIN